VTQALTADVRSGARTRGDGLSSRSSRQAIRRSRRATSLWSSSRPLSSSAISSRRGRYVPRSRLAASSMHRSIRPSPSPKRPGYHSRSRSRWDPWRPARRGQQPDERVEGMLVAPNLDLTEYGRALVRVFEQQVETRCLPRAAAVCEPHAAGRSRGPHLPIDVLEGKPVAFGRVLSYQPRGHVVCPRDSARRQAPLEQRVAAPW
jgi:hypothetical protein